MFKEITSGLSKFFTKQMVFTFLMLIFLAVVLIYYSGSKTAAVDGMHTGLSGSSDVSAPAQAAAPIVSNSAPVNAPTTSGNGNYALQPVANPGDLLPKDSNSDWGTFNNINQTNVATPDLLQAGYHIGLDTIGQSLRNANLQLRSDPVIPKKDIGPWLNSTIEPDYGRVPLELGQGCR
jgi:hypothetical protein